MKIKKEVVMEELDDEDEVVETGIEEVMDMAVQ